MIQFPMYYIDHTDSLIDRNMTIIDDHIISYLIVRIQRGVTKLLHIILLVLFATIYNLTTMYGHVWSQMLCTVYSGRCMYTIYFILYTIMHYTIIHAICCIIGVSPWHHVASYKRDPTKPTEESAQLTEGTKHQNYAILYDNTCFIFNIIIIIITIQMLLQNVNCIHIISCYTYVHNICIHNICIHAFIHSLIHPFLIPINQW